MSRELGRTLNETLRGTTWRQFLMWCRWLDEQWNRPNRTDHYLMKMISTQSSKKLTSDQLKIRFGRVVEQDLTKLSKEQLDAMSAQIAAVWRVRLGVKSPEAREKLRKARLAAQEDAQDQREPRDRDNAQRARDW